MDPHRRPGSFIWALRRLLARYWRYCAPSERKYFANGFIQSCRRTLSRNLSTRALTSRILVGILGGGMFPSMDAIVDTSEVFSLQAGLLIFLWDGAVVRVGEHSEPVRRSVEIGVISQTSKDAGSASFSNFNCSGLL